MLIIIFLSYFLFCSEKSLIKMVKKAVSTGKMSKKSVIKPYFEKHFWNLFFVKIDFELVIPLETWKIDIQTCMRWQKLPMRL